MNFIIWFCELTAYNTYNDFALIIELEVNMLPLGFAPSFKKNKIVYTNKAFPFLPMCTTDLGFSILHSDTPQLCPTCVV